MDISAPSLLRLVRMTLRSPQDAAAALIAFNPPVQARWLALAVVVVLSVLLGKVSMLMVGGSSMGLPSNIIVSTVLQGGVLLLTVALVHRIGMVFGGTGAADDTLLLMIWLQFLMVLLQAMQIVLLVILPPFAGLLGIAGFVLFLWLLSHFVMHVHGFKSLARVFGMIIATFFVVGFALSLLMIMLGIAPPGFADV